MSARPKVLFAIACWLLFGAAASGTAALAEEAGLQLRENERIALVGGGLAERTRAFGHFETMLQLRRPGLKLAVRNFGWPADEVGHQQRPNDYTKLDDPLAVFDPDLLLCFFGFNESFAGPEGIAKFKSDYLRFFDTMTARLKPDGGLRFVLISPIAYESTDDPLLPDGKRENANLALYTEAIREIAAERGLLFVDLFTPTRELFEAEAGAQFTTGGILVNEAGDLAVARHLDRAFFPGEASLEVGTPRYEQLRAAVIDKEWHHHHDYRMVNGWYVYGGRNTPFGVVNFPAEFAKIRKMVANRDQRIWQIAAGQDVPPEVDDSNTGELVQVPTSFGTKQYSEPDELRILSPEEALKAMEVAPGYRVQTFASEEMFPELANPVQINFDNRGRLWAACMPTYPQWRPGDPPPSDRLLIFEDTDGDGVADAVKVFADNLHIPTGFEFYDGGVLVTDQPRLVFLKDSTGDDRADVREVVFDGFATDDTHHAICAFEYTPGGELVMLEGISMSTTLETPWGPFRHLNRSVAYRLDPRTLRMNIHVTPCFANPWCYTNNDWGQGFIGDGTGANQHWATPLSGAAFDERKGTDQFIRYDGDRMRPALGNEFIYSRHFPDDAQGNFIYACVINMNGILQFKVREEGSGYVGERLTDLVRSPDRNFRPGDPQVGPDGALYFADWHNPLIGHMQYSQRDPNRDKRHGRIYRLTAIDRPLVEPVTQHGKSIPELLEQFRSYEARTRYRVRRELRDRPTAEVVAAIDAWVAALDPADSQYDLLITEALWVQQGHHAVQPALLEKVLAATTPNARAAAAHVIGGEHERLSGAIDYLRPLVADEHPRVRLEAVRALSFLNTSEAIELALEAARHDMDYYVAYTLESTLGACRDVWANDPQFQEVLLESNPVGAAFLANVTAGSSYGAAARALLRVLTGQATITADQKKRAEDELLALSGNADSGAKVFQRACVACHKIDEDGAKFGPNLSDVGTRLRPEEILESILDPSAKVDPKYQAVTILSTDGQIYTGLLVEQTDESVSIHVGGEKLVTLATDEIEELEKLNISSMPERLSESMSGEEFVDLFSFLRAQQAKLPEAIGAGE